ncbi:MAG: carbohydrate-binding domain-containing protein [Lachnospirales bacterium]
MKKRFSLILIMAMIGGTVGCNFTTAATNEVSVYEVKGSEEKIPARLALESIGYDTNWESTNKTLYATKGKNVIVLTLNSDTALLNGDKVKLNLPCTIENGSMNITVASINYLTGKEFNSDGNVIEVEEVSDDSWKENKVNVDLTGISDSIYEINTNGVYTLTGNYKGMIKINTDGKVKLILNNVNIENENGPAIYFENSKKGIIELQENTTNTLTDGKEYLVDAKGCVFSNDDLDIQGTGTLNINGNYNHGIVSDDDIDIKESNLNIKTSVGDGIKANDGIEIESGVINLDVMEDGISGDKCVVINDGDITITTRGEIAESSNEEFDMSKGGERGFMNRENKQPPENNNIDFQSAPPEKPMGEKPDREKFEIPLDENREYNKEETNAETTDNISSKGIKSDRNITINGGKITINSTDHSIKSDDIIVINNGNIDITSEKGKGIKAMGCIFVNSGDVNITSKDEGIETKATLTVNDGNVNIKSDEDGINAGGGDTRAMNNAEESYNHQIVFNGGKVTVNSKGDGIDSNGNLFFYGGDITVYGPTSGGNGALDSAGLCQYYGGELMAIGSAGMVEYPESCGGNILGITLEEVQNEGSTILIMDSENKTIYETVSPKEFQNITYASDKLKTGEKYKLYINGEETLEILASEGVTKYGNSDRNFGMRDGMGQNRGGRFLQQ